MPTPGGAGAGPGAAGAVEGLAMLLCRTGTLEAQPIRGTDKKLAAVSPKNSLRVAMSFHPTVKSNIATIAYAEGKKNLPNFRLRNDTAACAIHKFRIRNSFNASVIRLVNGRHSNNKVFIYGATQYSSVVPDEFFHRTN
jgi:hypothetical protein